MAARDRRLHKSSAIVWNSDCDTVGAGNTEGLVSLSKFTSYRAVSNNLKLRFAYVF